MGTNFTSNPLRAKGLFGNGKPTPTVSWFIGDKLVNGVTEERSPGVVVNRLEVRDIRRAHLNATLRCQASNTKLALPVERSLKLDLLLELRGNSFTNINALVIRVYLYGVFGVRYMMTYKN
ncbi:hypothetical protein J437_LFUL014243 [Ladona fulva]|uniref:Ig-like domain-containing protein n=1 Tax=Ladona fulva TaxID=123851 RepID=A0A8K0NX81_LADFU|nr:hypothetical protein J437_LFUL014243 [Ladona fulva]